MTRSQQTGTQTFEDCTGGMSHPCKSNCSGLYTETLLMGWRLKHWIRFWYFVFSWLSLNFIGFLLSRCGVGRCTMPLSSRLTFRGVELAMYVRVLSAFLVMLL